MTWFELALDRKFVSVDGCLDFHQYSDSYGN
jgi:hypothetical protein